MNDKYNLITSYIRRCETDIDRHRKLFTLSLEKDPKKLDQWIEYLSDADILEAALAVNDLKNKDEKYISFLTNKLVTAETNYKTILSLLYLDKHEEIIKRINDIKDDESSKETTNFDYAEYDEEFTDETIIEEEKVENTKSSYIKVSDNYHVPDYLAIMNRQIYSYVIGQSSNYDLFIKYIIDLAISDNYEAIYKILNKIDKIIITPKIKENIKKVINILLDKQEYILSLQVLKSLNLEYDEYISINSEEYITYIEENYDSLIALDFINDLSLKKLSLKDYYNRIRNNFSTKENIINNLKIIIKLIISGENLSDYKEDINKIKEYYIENNIFFFEIEINDLFADLFNYVMLNNSHELINIINLFDLTNPYKYTEQQRSITYIRVKNKYNSLDKLLNSCDNFINDKTISEKDKIFIYMNTHMKLLFTLTDYLCMINPNFKGSTDAYNVKEWFEDYIFYTMIFTINKTNGRVRSKIINAQENNKIRGSIISIESKLGHKINKNMIIRTKINTYYPYDNSFKLEYLKSETNMNQNKDEYEEIYNRLSNNLDIPNKVLESNKIGHSINFNTAIETTRLFDLQIKALKEVKNNYKNLIIILKKDTVNPFKWVNSGAESVETARFITFKKRLKNYYKYTENIRTEVYNSLISLIESDASLDEIIFIYMNTCYKYNVSINDLLGLLIRNNKMVDVPNENDVYDLTKLFADYKFKGKIINVDKENKTITLSSHQLWTFNLSYNYTVENIDELIKSHKYMKFYLLEYAYGINIFKIYKLKKSKRTINNPTVNYIDKILLYIKNDRDVDSYIDKLSDTAEVDLFEDEISFGEKKDETNPIPNHIHHYITTLNLFLNKPNSVYKLLNALDKNNIFRYPRHLSQQGLIEYNKLNSANMIKKLLKEDFKSYDNIYELIFIYFNTMIKQLMPLDQLLKTYCDNHNIINRKLDLNKCSTNLQIRYINDKWTIDYVQFNGKILFDNELNINNTYITNIKCYHPGTNELTLVIKEKMKD